MNFLLLEGDIVGDGMQAIISKVASFIVDKFGNSTPDLMSQFTDTSNGVINAISTGTFGNLVDSFVPVGCMMAMIYLSKEFFEKTTLKNIDMEQIFKMFLKLIVACIIISNVKSLIIGFDAFTTAITSELQSSLSTVLDPDLKNAWTDIIAHVLQTDDTKGFFDYLMEATGMATVLDLLITVIYAICLIIGTLIYTIAIEFASYSRAMTIGYKALYAPIAVSNIVGYSTRNAAVSYLKGVFATFMQMPIALLGVSLSTNTAILLINEHPILAIAVYFSGIGWVSGSQRLAKELFC